MRARFASARPGLAALLALSLLAARGAANAAPAAPIERARVPALKLRTVEGESLAIEKLLDAGPVVFAFWATWCHPCLAELPELEAIYRRHRDRGLTVIGLSVDGPRNFAKVRPFAAKLGLTFPIVVDEDGRVQRLFQVGAVPTTVVIDSAGVIVRVQEGYRPGDSAPLEAEIAKLVAPAQDGAPKQ